MSVRRDDTWSALSHKKAPRRRVRRVAAPVSSPLLTVHCVCIVCAIVRRARVVGGVKAHAWRSLLLANNRGNSLETRRTRATTPHATRLASAAGIPPPIQTPLTDSPLAPTHRPLAAGVAVAVGQCPPSCVALRCIALQQLQRVLFRVESSFTEAIAGAAAAAAAATGAAARRPQERCCCAATGDSSAPQMRAARGHNSTPASRTPRVQSERSAARCRLTAGVAGNCRSRDSRANRVCSHSHSHTQSSQSSLKSNLFIQSQKPNKRPLVLLLLMCWYLNCHRDVDFNKTLLLTPQKTSCLLIYLINHPNLSSINFYLIISFSTQSNSRQI